MEALFLSILAFFSTLSGGLFSLKFRDKLHYIMSFTAGVLVAVCFFDILPEVISLSTERNLPIINALIALVVGFLAFHILEKAVIIHHAHETEYEAHQHHGGLIDHHHQTVGLVGALGLAFHSFLDGVGIGLGFHVDPHVGLLIAVAVIAHDFSDGLNTVTLMLTNKNTTKKSLMLLLLDATTPILGVLSTYVLSIAPQFLQVYLGFFAGFLLYIGASDLLPEAHSKHSSYRMILLTIVGVIFIFFVTRLV
ncbi:MAG: ZIP family metal transporter [Candidatus Levyibacteriota bacterium]